MARTIDFENLLSDVPNQLDTILGPTTGQSTTSEVIRAQPGVSTNPAEALRLKRLLTSGADTRGARRFRGEQETIRRRKANEAIDARKIKQAQAVADIEVGAQQKIEGAKQTGRVALQSAEFGFEEGVLATKQKFADAQQGKLFDQQFGLLNQKAQNDIVATSAELTADQILAQTNLEGDLQLQRENNASKIEQLRLSGDIEGANRLAVQGAANEARAKLKFWEELAGKAAEDKKAPVPSLRKAGIKTGTEALKPLSPAEADEFDAIDNVLQNQADQLRPSEKRRLEKRLKDLDARI